MAKKTLVERLQNMAEVVLDAEFSDTLKEAASTLLDMERKIELLNTKVNCMTVTVTLSHDQLKDTISKAFEECTGKDFEYVVQAVKEKMEREGEYVEEETTEESDT